MVFLVSAFGLNKSKWEQTRRLRLKTVLTFTGRIARCEVHLAAPRRSSLWFWTTWLRGLSDRQVGRVSGAIMVETSYQAVSTPFENKVMESCSIKCPMTGLPRRNRAAATLVCGQWELLFGWNKMDNKILPVSLQTAAKYVVSLVTSVGLKVSVIDPSFTYSIFEHVLKTTKRRPWWTNRSCERWYKLPLVLFPHGFRCILKSSDGFMMLEDVWWRGSVHVH